MASISAVLQRQYQVMQIAVEIMANLRNMFATQNQAAKSLVIRSIMTRTINEGASVTNHVLEMMAQLNKSEVLGGVINSKSQVSVILQCLHSSYRKFKLNYEMNKKVYTLAELLTKLHTTEGLLAHDKVALISHKPSSTGSKPKVGGKKKHVSAPSIVKTTSKKKKT